MDRRTRIAIDGQVVEFSSLDKVMYPDTGTTKSDVLRYYMLVADHLITHARNRPATVRRWVKGVGTAEQPEEAFFQKDAGDAPAWVSTVGLDHSGRRTTYPVVDRTATLAWLVQRDVLEVHTPQWRMGPHGRARPPDRLVIDLDPGKGMGLSHCAEVAHLVREALGEVGLGAQPVTSGSKGIHLYAELDGSVTSDDASSLARDLARRIESARPDLVVSGMSKSRRDGRVFIDWSQNNAAKSTITPYSLRGRSRPTVAAPRTWDELDDPALEQLEMGEVLARLDRTIPAGEGRFSIDEHRVRTVHLDLVLDYAGSSCCWILPSGLPPPGGSGIALLTDEWPVVGREGDFPSRERMRDRTPWDTGSLTVHRWNVGTDLLITLHPAGGGALDSDRVVRLVHIGSPGQDDDHWSVSVERPDDEAAEGQGSAPPAARVAPMLASRAGTAERFGTDWRFEMKWDGARAVGTVEDGVARLWSRNGRDLTDRFPEVARDLAAALGGHDAIVDGELVALDAANRPSFELLSTRLGARTVAARVKAARVRASLLLFDVMSLDGSAVIELPYLERRRILEELVHPGPLVLVPPSYPIELEAALRASRDLGLEGVMAKRADSPYRPGERSEDWRKIKDAQTTSAVAAGWLDGEAGGLGSLVVAVPGAAGLRYAGRVGSGLSASDRQSLDERLRPLSVPTPAAADVPRDIASRAHWVAPVTVVDIRHEGWTRAGRLRHPVWNGLRLDLDPGDVAAP